MNTFNAAVSTIVSDEARSRLAADLTLGAGNFITYAMAASPNTRENIIFLERELRTYRGDAFTALSLNDLHRVASEYSQFYYHKGIQPKDTVAIYRSDGVEYLIHYLALTKLGAIVVLVNGALQAEIAAAFIRKVKPQAIFSDSEHFEPLKAALKHEAPALFFQDEHIAGQQFPPIPENVHYQHLDGDPVIVAHSSGTTGIPKPVTLEHDRYFYGIRYRLRMPRLKGNERILSSLPHSHNCAIAYIMLALLSGTQVYITTDHSGRNVLRRISEFHPSMVVSFPQTYVEMTEENLSSYDLTSVQLWFNGGDAAHETHIRKLVAQGTHFEGRRMLTGSYFVDGMGSSEMGFSLFRHVHTPTSNDYGRCVGLPLEWVEAAALSDDGQILPPYKVGKLGVKAPSVTSGYWNDSNLTYKSKLSGYWLTGDLAYHDDAGRFYHVDRVPDRIITEHGHVYSLETEEMILSSFDYILDCSVVAASDESGAQIALALLRIRNDYKFNETTFINKLNESLRIRGRNPITRAEVVSSCEIPLGATGKVLKRALRDQYATN